MRAALTMLILFAGSSAYADGLCGITARVCRSAETKLMSRYLTKVEPWYMLQDWSPWSISIDPGTRTVDVRFRFGGHADNRGGIGFADDEEQSLHHDVRSCTGSVASGKVELDVGGEQTLTLVFENGKLVRVLDREARAKAGYGVAMVARDMREEDPGVQELEWKARNVTFACPGGGQSASGVTSSGGSSTAPGAKKGKPGQQAAAAASDGDRYEKAQSKPGPQQRQQDTGEQGGAGGAKLVEFGGERFRMTDTSITHLDSGIEIMRRPSGPPVTYAGAATGCPSGWHLFDSVKKPKWGYESNLLGYLDQEAVFPGLDHETPYWVGTAGHPEMRAATMAMTLNSFSAGEPADRKLRPLCSRWR